MTIYKGTVELSYTLTCDDDNEFQKQRDQMEDDILGIFGVDEVRLIDVTDVYTISADEYLADDINDRRKNGDI